MESLRRLWQACREGQADDDDGRVLDFVFDGTIRTSSFQRTGGRRKVVALQRLVDDHLQGYADAAAMRGAIDDLRHGVGRAVVHFQQAAGRSAPHADFCWRNVDAYVRIDDALRHMLAWFEDPSRTAYLTQGLDAVERAVSDVDALVAEEEDEMAS
ncbi:MAG: hypothetical protein FJX76_15790 [Armatimonadetes bacterium]|nr:hypothetical protein [Armatimonadota bacterium]